MGICSKTCSAGEATRIWGRLSYILIFVGFMLLAKAWDVLCAAQSEHRLATTGPYAWVRHPQYVCFVVIMIGFLFQWPTLATLAMFPVLVWFYVRLARREKADSAAAFGEQWAAFAIDAGVHSAT